MGLARGSFAHFLDCYRDLRALRTYPIYPIRRGMKACTSEKLDLSFLARPSPNRQNLDESVRNLVCKPNNSVLEIVVGTRQLDLGSDDGHRRHPIILVVV